MVRERLAQDTAEDFALMLWNMMHASSVKDWRKRLTFGEDC